MNLLTHLYIYDAKMCCKSTKTPILLFTRPLGKARLEIMLESWNN